MSITGDMFIDYEMASADEFLEYYGDAMRWNNWEEEYYASHNN